MRPDVFSYLDWTSLYDVSPMRKTLAEVCDFKQLNDPTHISVAVTATNVQTGDQVCFANFVGNPDSVYYVTPRISRVSLTLPAESPVRQRESFRRLVRLRALKNIKVIEADHAPMTGGMDFSAHGVHTRYKSGYAAVDKLLTGVAT